jgi:hypothetical protein
MELVLSFLSYGAFSYLFWRCWLAVSDAKYDVADWITFAYMKGAIGGTWLATTLFLGNTILSSLRWGAQKGNPMTSLICCMLLPILGAVYGSGVGGLAGVLIAWLGRSLESHTQVEGPEQSIAPRSVDGSSAQKISRSGWTIFFYWLVALLTLLSFAILIGLTHLFGEMARVFN